MPGSERVTKPPASVHKATSSSKHAQPTKLDADPGQGERSDPETLTSGVRLSLANLQAKANQSEVVQRHQEMQERANRATQSWFSQTGFPIQRVIETALPTRFYRRKDGSESARVNTKIGAYNAGVISGWDAERRREALEEISGLLGGVSEKKAPHVEKIRDEIADELRELVAIRHVQETVTERQRLQLEDPKRDVDGITEEELAYYRRIEVTHGMNPLVGIDENQTVGDAMAASGQLKNVHQTGTSAIGSGGDSDKRATAEIGLFYPERYRRESFSRSAQDNPTETKGIDPDLRPPSQALPKYAALNLAGSPFGALGNALGTEGSPLHFAIKPEVLMERATVTPGDTLREWTPHESDFDQLVRGGYVSDESKVPTDDLPWETGPVARYGSENMRQVLGERGLTHMDLQKEGATNPSQYVEAQIHGDLRLDRDIAFVRANFAKLFGNDRFNSLYESFRDKGTEIRWYFRFDQSEGQAVFAEGNRLTESWEEQSSKVFSSAWQQARTIRAQDLRQMTSREGTFALYDEALEAKLRTGALFKNGREAIFGLWNTLVGQVGNGE